MKMRVPLFVKIIGWFFVNIALLAAAAWFLTRGQLRFSIFSKEAVLARVEPVINQLTAELPPSGTEKMWAGILEKYTAERGVKFSMYDENGRLVAGTQLALPPEIHGRMVNAARREGRRLGPPGRRFDEFEDPEGRPPRLFDGPPMFDGPPGQRPIPSELPTRAVIETDSPKTYWTIFRKPFSGVRGQTAYFMTTSDSPTGNGFYFDITPLIAAGAGALVLSAFIWIPFVRGVTRAVGRMRDATTEIAEGHFDARTEATRRDELGELGGEINRMAARLGGYVNGQKRFLGDVAHELCAPIARLQMALGILEQRAPASERTRVADVREEVEHMAGLVNELLQFSRAEVSGRKANLQPVRLRAVAEKAIHREAGDISAVQIEVPEEIEASADPDLLQRAVGNLLRNAIRYAGHAGPITVAAVKEDDHVHITVADSGPGIPAGALAKIFDPFFRVDEARTPGSAGAGLGLAIVKTCVEACGGTVTARNLAPVGLEVGIRLAAA